MNKKGDTLKIYIQQNNDKLHFICTFEQSLSLWTEVNLASVSVLSLTVYWKIPLSCAAYARAKPANEGSTTPRKNSASIAVQVDTDTEKNENLSSA